MENSSTRYHEFNKPQVRSCCDCVPNLSQPQIGDICLITTPYGKLWGFKLSETNGITFMGVSGYP